MLRFLMFGAILLALGSAFVLYAINTKTRRIAIEVADKQNAKKKLISRISVLKAERAYLSRATRIAPAAERLGLRPAQGHQFRHSALPQAGNARPSGRAAPATKR